MGLGLLNDGNTGKAASTVRDQEFFHLLPAQHAVYWRKRVGVGHTGANHLAPQRKQRRQLALGAGTGYGRSGLGGPEGRLQ